MSIATEPLLLCPELAGTLMTPEEFDAAEIGDEEFRYELLHGVLIVSPPPHAFERCANEQLGHLLLLYRKQHPQGAAMRATLTEHDVKTPQNRRRADRAIWAGLGGTPDIDVDLPNILVEFVSESRRDRRRDYEEKRDEYRALGIAEYWIIDRFRRQLTVMFPLTANPPERILAEAATYTTPLLPGFELSLAMLLGEVDRLKQAKR